MKFKKTQITKILGCSQATEDKWIDAINATCEKFAINTKLRLAAFIAQVGHESGRLSTVTENLNYSAAGLLGTWPARFDTFSANACARNPEKIANKVYGGRMGNMAEGDGWKYRGRGLIQCTGKSNYDSFSQSCGVDAISNPDSLTQPTNAALSAGWFWNSKGLNAYADRGDFLTITKRINGGTNGQAEREMLYKKAIIVLSDEALPSDDELAKKPLEVTPDSTSQVSDQKTPAAQNSSIVEPRSVAGGATSKYPWNLVTESRSGHTSEVDDTPGNERVNVSHRTGSYWEFDRLGTFTIKSILDSYKLTKGDAYDFTGGNYTQRVKGQSYRQSSGDMVFKTEGQMYLNASRVQVNTGMMAVSGEINAPNINANMFSGMGGLAFGDMLAKQALVAYDIIKGKAPMLGGSMGFKGKDGGGSADGAMSNNLSNKAPNGTPWVTNGVAVATAAVGVSAAALAIKGLLSSNDTSSAMSNALNSAADEANQAAAADASQTPVFLKHVSFDKPTLLSQSTSIDLPDPSLYQNNYHTIVDAQGKGVLHISDGSAWIQVGSSGEANNYTDAQIDALSGVVADNQTNNAAALLAEAQARTAAILNEAAARTAALIEEATARQQAITNGLLAEAVARGAAVTAEATARQTEDESLATHITTLTASTAADIASAVEVERIARTTAISAEATARETLAATVAGNTASINSESITRANADSALSTTITNNIATTANNLAAVRSEVIALANAGDSALSSRIDTQVTATNANAAAITSEATTRTNADSALATSITTLSANTATNIAAAVQTETTARTNADSALSSRIDTVVATANSNTAAITSEATTRANADSANASSISTVSAVANSALTNAATAQTKADTAFNNAATAQIAADAANTEIGNIVADNVLSRVEKSTIILDYNNIINEKAGIDAQADLYAVSKTTYGAAVAALTSYLTGLTPAYTDLTQNTTIVGTTFRTKFSDVYTARQVLLNGITAAAKGLINTAQSRADTAFTNAATAQTDANTANTALANIASDNVLSKGEKSTVILDWNSISAEQSGIDTQADNFAVSRTAYDAAVSALSTYLISIDYSNTATDTAIVGATFRTKFSDVYTARQAVLNAIATKAKLLADTAQSKADSAFTNAATAQTAANTANTAIANIASDNVLSMGEKSQVIVDWTNISNEQAGIDAQADAFVVSRTAYDAAVSALATYLSGLSPAWNNTAADTAIVGTTFRTKFSDVYSARQALLNAIYAKAKAIADSKTKTFRQGTTPTAITVGDIWYDTANNNRAKVWDGASWLDTTDTRVTQNAADIVTEQTARANGDTANANLITTLTTTVNGHTTSISTNTSSINGVAANYGVNINNNGVVSGFKLLSTAQNAGATSAFIIEADKFALVKPGTVGNAQAPFSVDTTTNPPNIVMAGNVKVGMLSTLSPSIGTLRTTASGGRTEISDNVIKVYDASNVLRVQIGNLSL